MDDQEYAAKQAELATLEQQVETVKQALKDNRYVFIDVEWTLDQCYEIADKLSHRDLLYDWHEWQGIRMDYIKGNKTEGYHAFDFNGKRYDLNGDEIVYGVVKCPRDNTKLRAVLENRLRTKEKDNA